MPGLSMKSRQGKSKPIFCGFLHFANWRSGRAAERVPQSGFHENHLIGAESANQCVQVQWSAPAAYPAIVAGVRVFGLSQFPSVRGNTVSKAPNNLYADWIPTEILRGRFAGTRLGAIFRSVCVAYSNASRTGKACVLITGGQ